MATITGTSGPVAAQLIGLDSLPTQAIPLFRLPGLATGALLLRVNLTHAGSGTVTVQVKSLSNPAIVATITATVSDLSVLLLDPTEDGALAASGQGQITVSGALIVDSMDDEAVEISGQGRVSAAETDIGGTPGTEISGDGRLQGTVRRGQPRLPDPLLSLTAPTVPQQVYHDVHYDGHDLVTLQPGTYEGGIQLSDDVVATLAPGIYYLEGGGLSVSGNARLIGKGVLIYLTSSGDHGDDDHEDDGEAGISITGQGSAFLTASASGTYAGLAIFLDRNARARIEVSGEASLNVSGGLYAAQALVDISGEGALTVTATLTIPPLIADALNVSGQASVTLTATEADGTLAGPQGQVRSEQTASLGFWQEQGQAAIRSFNGGASSTALGGWLAGNFPNLFGNLKGQSNAAVAQVVAAARDDIFGEALALALNMYATTFSLGGESLVDNGLAAALDLQVTFPGDGSTTFNVAANAAAFDLTAGQGTTLTLLQILQTVDRHYNPATGTFYNGDLTLMREVFDVLDAINRTGDG